MSEAHFCTVDSLIRRFLISLLFSSHLVAISGVTSTQLVSMDGGFGGRGRAVMLVFLSWLSRGPIPHPDPCSCTRSGAGTPDCEIRSSGSATRVDRVQLIPQPLGMSTSARCQGGQVTSQRVGRGLQHVHPVAVVGQ